ncbi:hypothetical protein MNBD_PLANCTO03-1709 [hydrothermal vent metagenome]|uniref:Uncharacterized protein n=1 Tax=hydrothermal vent metagenome TaxID=652676 RepID=A0A3B1DSJ8_9ZZZZ
MYIERVAGLVGLMVFAGAAVAQGDRPTLELADRGIRVEPIRVAPAVYQDGSLQRTGEWIDYSTPPTRGGDTCRDNRVFECYGDHDFDGFPDDAGGCEKGSSRWYFGTGFCGATSYTNDMTVAPDTIISEGVWRTDLAWYWTGDGSGTEQCVIAIFLEESDANNCEPDSFDYPGWMIDLGELATNPGYYYYSLIDIETLGRWTLPQDGSGSYAIKFLTDNGNQPATCVQTMYWGSPNNTGGDPDGPGWQGPYQIEYDECYDLTFGVCPDPLGGMAQFWGTRENPPGDRADFNGDGLTDTRDVMAFLVAWAACAPETDCTRDGLCDTRDVLCYLELWAECRD